MLTKRFSDLEYQRNHHDMLCAAMVAATIINTRPGRKRGARLVEAKDLVKDVRPSGPPMLTPEDAIVRWKMLKRSLRQLGDKIKSEKKSDG